MTEKRKNTIFSNVGGRRGNFALPRRERASQAEHILGRQGGREIKKKKTMMPRDC